MIGQPVRRRSTRTCSSKELYRTRIWTHGTIAQRSRRNRRRQDFFDPIVRNKASNGSPVSRRQWLSRSRTDNGTSKLERAYTSTTHIACLCKGKQFVSAFRWSIKYSKTCTANSYRFLSAIPSDKRNGFTCLFSDDGHFFERSHAIQIAV